MPAQGHVLLSRAAPSAQRRSASVRRAPRYPPRIYPRYTRSAQRSKMERCFAVRPFSVSGSKIDRMSFTLSTSGFLPSPYALSIANEAAGRERYHTQHTGPTCYFCARRIPKQKIQARGNAEGQKRTDKQPRVEPEKDGLLILANLFWNFDFDRLSLQ